jgi:hypothetical protein
MMIGSAADRPSRLVCFGTRRLGSELELSRDGPGVEGIATLDGSTTSAIGIRSACGVGVGIDATRAVTEVMAGFGAPEGL